MRRGPARIPAGEFVLLDVTRIDQETHVRVRILEDGTMSSDWLVAGRDYAFVGMSTSGRSAFLRWDGREEIDLGALPDNMSTFDRLVGRNYDDLR